MKKTENELPEFPNESQSHCAMSPVASTGILRVPVADSVDGTDCTLQPLSGSDSKARAPNDHGDEGLHATGTNICQLPRAAGKEKKAQNESSHRSLSCSCETHRYPSSLQL